MSPQIWRLVALCGASVALACGGEVNLGGKRDNGAPPSDSGGEEATGPDAPAGRPVAQLTAEIQVHFLAVTDDDFLYVGNFSGMSRCRKDNCIPTLELLASVGTNIIWVEGYERSLAVSHGDSNRTSFATYSLPTLAEQSVVLRDLPGGQSRPLWHAGYLFFAIAEDASVYRCSLPSCSGGPERVGAVRNEPHLTAEGQSLFWHDESFIYRSDELGAGPVLTLLADDTLNEASEEVKSDPVQRPLDYISAIATGPATLYAALGHPATPLNCYSGCPHSVVRWSVGGGSRVEVVTSPSFIEQLFIFGDELVWSETDSQQSETVTLWSCLASSCSETRRRLGTGAKYWIGAIVADSSSLYWLEAGMNATPSEGAVKFTNRQIRRAPRLDPNEHSAD